jgi:hypothetical protein
MNLLRHMIVSITLLSSGVASAAFNPTRELNQDSMLFTPYDTILLLSSFDKTDHITAYSDYGTLLWDVTMYRTVLSWKLKGNHLYVFSRHHSKQSTTISCIDTITGAVLWERP